MAYEVFEIERTSTSDRLARESRAAERHGPGLLGRAPARHGRSSSTTTPCARSCIAARGAHFTVGLDLKSMGGGIIESGNGAGARKRLLDFILKIQRTVTTVARCEKPVIAVAHGWCIGGGIDLLTACDIRIAAADVTFSIRETKMAMVADVGTLQRLPGIIGRGQVAELAFSGDDFGAERALAMGFVNSRPPRPGVRAGGGPGARGADRRQLAARGHGDQARARVLRRQERRGRAHLRRDLERGVRRERGSAGGRDGLLREASAVVSRALNGADRGFRGGRLL